MGVSHSISKQSIRYTDRSKDKDRVYRIPLDVAVQAVVLLQKRARIVVAKKKVEQVRQNLITSHELATNYLEQVKTRATSSSAKSLHSNNLGLARSSSVMAMAKARCNLYPTDKLATKAFHYLFTREHSPAAIIYPLVGFVVQAKLQSQTSSGISYDVFINLCHHPYISQMTGTLPRLQPMSASATTKIHGHSTRQQDAATTATSFDTLPGLAAAGGDNRVAIVFDVLISSLEYDDEFVYMDGVGVIPLRKNSKEKFATAVINYLNSQDFLSRINTKTLVPLFQQVFMDVSRGSIGLDFYLPRLPRPYVGDISPLVLRKSGEEQLLHYLESSATQNPTSNHTGSVPNTPATAASTSPRYASNNLLSSDSLTQVRKVPPVIQGWLTLGNGMYDVPRQSMDEIDFSSALSSSQRAKEHRGNENLFDGLVDEGEEDDYEFIKHRHTISQKLKAEKLQETSGNESVYAVLNCGVLTLYRQRSTLSEDTEGTKPSYINNYYRNEMSTYNNTAVAGESELIPPNCEEIVRFILCSHAVNTEMSTGNGVFAVHFVPLTALPVAAESMTYSLTSSPRSRALNAASDNGRKLHDFSSIPPLASQYRASPTMIRDCISLFFNRAKSHTLEGYNLYDSGIDPISKDMDDRQLARSKKESPKATKEKVTNSENKLTLKFHSFSEILTWKLYIAEHMNFSADRIRTVIGASQLDFSTVADTIERSQSSSPRVVSGAGHGNRMRMMESIDEREQLEEAGADKEENDVTSHCRVNGAIDGADIVRPSEMLKNERKSITTFDEIVENTEDMPFADLANPINSSATTASPVFEELKLNRKTEVRLQDNNMDGISNTDKPVRKSFIKLAGFKESSILPHSHHTENGSRVLDEKDFHAKTVKSKNEVTQSTRIANDVEISQTKKDEHEEYKKVPEQRMALPVVPPIDTSAPQRNFHDPLADDKFSPKKESAKTTLGLAKVLEYLTVPERLLIRFGGWVRVSKAVGVLSELSESQLAEMDGAIDSNSLFNDIPVYLEIDCGFMKLFYREHDPEYDELSIPFAVIPLANTVMFAQPITASEQPQIFSDGIPAAVAAIFTGTGKSISAAGSSPNADDQPTVETIGTALSVCNPGGCFPKEVLIGKF